MSADVSTNGAKRQWRDPTKASLARMDKVATASRAARAEALVAAGSPTDVIHATLRKEFGMSVAPQKLASIRRHLRRSRGAKKAAKTRAERKGRPTFDALPATKAYAPVTLIKTARPSTVMEAAAAVFAALEPLNPAERAKVLSAVSTLVSQ